MAEVMRLGVLAGRKAFLAGRIAAKLHASASSRIDGLIRIGPGSRPQGSAKSQNPPGKQVNGGQQGAPNAHTPPGPRQQWPPTQAKSGAGPRTGGHSDESTQEFGTQAPEKLPVCTQCVSGSQHGMLPSD